ncbi:hypothetical protein VTK56DRAFT_1457 [Thermocarpiscus australiensis]
MSEWSWALCENGTTRQVCHNGHSRSPQRTRLVFVGCLASPFLLADYSHRRIYIAPDYPYQARSRVSRLCRIRTYSLSMSTD